MPKCLINFNNISCKIKGPSHWSGEPDLVWMAYGIAFISNIEAHGGLSVHPRFNGADFHGLL